MARHITYNAKGYSKYSTVSFGYGCKSRGDIEKEIVNIIKNSGMNIQVIKTRYTKCTCKKCGDTHQVTHESVDETFTKFINDNLERN